MKTRKAFTLVELLIVIAIIGILAVALLPGILKSPAKGRDTERINELRSVQSAFIDAHVALADYPAGSGPDGACITSSLDAKVNLSFADGIPTDPIKSNANYIGGTAKLCATNGEYLYVSFPATSPVKYAVIAKLETLKLANTDCTTAKTTAVAGSAPTTEAEACYIYTLPTK